jgi:hypothetical protein
LTGQVEDMSSILRKMLYRNVWLVRWKTCPACSENMFCRNQGIVEFELPPCLIHVFVAHHQLSGKWGKPTGYGAKFCAKRIRFTRQTWLDNEMHTPSSTLVHPKETLSSWLIETGYVAQWRTCSYIAAILHKIDRLHAAHSQNSPLAEVSLLAVNTMRRCSQMQSASSEQGQLRGPKSFSRRICCQRIDRVIECDDEGQYECSCWYPQLYFEILSWRPITMVFTRNTEISRWTALQPSEVSYDSLSKMLFSTSPESCRPGRDLAHFLDHILRYGPFTELETLTTVSEQYLHSWGHTYLLLTHCGSYKTTKHVIMFSSVLWPHLCHC